MHVIEAMVARASIALEQRREERIAAAKRERISDAADVPPETHSATDSSQLRSEREQPSTEKYELSDDVFVGLDEFVPLPVINKDPDNEDPDNWLTSEPKRSSAFLADTRVLDADGNDPSANVNLSAEDSNQPSEEDSADADDFAPIGEDMDELFRDVRTAASHDNSAKKRAREDKGDCTSIGSPTTDEDWLVRSGPLRDDFALSPAVADADADADGELHTLSLDKPIKQVQFSWFIDENADDTRKSSADVTSWIQRKTRRLSRLSSVLGKSPLAAILSPNRFRTVDDSLDTPEWESAERALDEYGEGACGKRKSA